TIRWWDVRTGRQRLCLPCTKNLTKPMPGWAPRPVLSPDGTILAAVCTEAPDGKDDMAEICKRSRSSICLWDAASGKELRRLDCDCGSGRVYEPAFSPDGQLLAQVSQVGQPPKMRFLVRLWGVATGKRREREFAGICPLFSPDGSILITLEGKGDKAISFWEIATGKKIGSFSPMKVVVTVDPMTGKPIKEIEKECIRCLALSPDGRTLAVASNNITLYFVSWNKQSGGHL